MRTQFTPYEVALRLEQLGFNEPCLGWYYLDEGVPVWSPNHQDLRKQHVKAPLWQQAIWFLNKYSADRHLAVYMSTDFLDNFEEDFLKQLTLLEKIIKPK